MLEATTGRIRERILVPRGALPDPLLLRTHPATDERTRRLRDLEPRDAGPRAAAAALAGHPLATAAVTTGITPSGGRREDGARRPWAIATPPPAPGAVEVVTMSRPSSEHVPSPDAGAAPPARFDDLEPWPDSNPTADPAGMLRFAALVLGITGIWHVIAGLVALGDPAYFRTTTAALPLHVSYQVWGWTHVIVGALAVAAAFGVVAGSRLASVIAVVLAVVSAVISLVFMKADPFWSVLIIGLDVLVVWGVTAQASPPEPAS